MASARAYRFCRRAREDAARSAEGQHSATVAASRRPGAAVLDVDDQHRDPHLAWLHVEVAGRRARCSGDPAHGMAGRLRPSLPRRRAVLACWRRQRRVASPPPALPPPPCRPLPCREDAATASVTGLRHSVDAGPGRDRECRCARYRDAGPCAAGNDAVMHHARDGAMHRVRHRRVARGRRRR